MEVRGVKREVRGRKGLERGFRERGGQRGKDKRGLEGFLFSKHGLGFSTLGGISGSRWFWLIFPR